jgi:hypothetical protein
MFPLRQGVSYGISSVRNTFNKGEEIPIHIWISNESPFEQQFSFCCETTFLQYFDLLDSAGHRIETAQEIRERKACEQDNLRARQEGLIPKACERGREELSGCDCSGITAVAPGSCKVIDGGTLNRADTAYDLQPGKYFIVEPQLPPNPDRSKSLLHEEERAKAVKHVEITINDKAP